VRISNRLFFNACTDAGEQGAALRSAVREHGGERRSQVSVNPFAFTPPRTFYPVPRFALPGDPSGTREGI